MGFGFRRSFKIATIAGVTSLLAGNVIAGQGWYLMAPPAHPNILWAASCVSEGKIPAQNCALVAVDRNAPLSKWKQVSAHDSANDCESTIGKFLALARSDRAKTQSNGNRNEEFAARVRELTWEDSRCVASDDPRLTSGR
jgi:hypothetical protein